MRGIIQVKEDRIMEIFKLYHHEIPVFLQECARTPAVLRLRDVGMNCGCEYTSFPRFCGLKPYSRFDHSLGAALIIWHFTADPVQAVAGLLHDIATPAFAHMVDFMRGDYLKQEATEAGTADIIEASAELQAVLKKYGLCSTAVSDYHRYPIADNDSPGLSADRLEYTLGNSINYGFCTGKRAEGWYRDLIVGKNEKGQPELTFRTAEAAEDFALTALRCSEVYVSDEDRYSMQMLAELLRDAVSRGVITENDLYTTEPQIISRLLSDKAMAVGWSNFCAYREILRREQPGTEENWRKISAKKRYIDPLVLHRGRMSAVSPVFSEKLSAFLCQSQDIWLLARH